MEAAVGTPLSYKLAAGIAFKAAGDIFHDLVGKKSDTLSNVTPSKVQDCVLHEGNYGTTGSTIEWKYTLDGKEQCAKQVIQEVDDANRLIVLKTIDGDLTELYKDMTISIHVETENEIDFVSWTVEYELLKPDNPHPFSLMNFFIGLTNEVEAHLLQG